MKLEIERLRLNLSAAERDRALLSIGTDPATINPNLLLDEYYMRRLCRIASSLALLGQASVEDKITAAIGLETTDDNVVDFWNISGIGESCAGGLCEVRVENEGPARTTSVVSPAADSASILCCSQCQRKVCKVCCSGRGALLLTSYSSKEAASNNGGSSHGGQADISTNRSVTLDGVICKQCCHDIVLDALILDHVRVLISLRRSARANSAAYDALKQVEVLPSRGCISEGDQSSDSQPTVKVLRQLVKGEESLAEFPSASFLQSV